MTISEFIDKYNIKEGHKVVKKWLEIDYVPGAYYDESSEKWIIPNSAKPPYTKARAKNAAAIYRSIVKACLCRRHVFAKLYKIGEEEFDTYIQQLSTAQIIEVKEIDDITYYFSTLKSEEFVSCKSPEKFLRECLAIIVENSTKGIAEAVIAASVHR